MILIIVLCISMSQYGVSRDGFRNFNRVFGIVLVLKCNIIHFHDQDVDNPKMSLIESNT